MMNELENAKLQLEWSRKLVATYEEEARETDVIELERKQLLEKLHENLGKLDALKCRMEGKRRDIRERLEELKQEYNQEGGAA